MLMWMPMGLFVYVDDDVCVYVDVNADVDVYVDVDGDVGVDMYVDVEGCSWVWMRMLM